MIYMTDWNICTPPGFSLGFEGDNEVTSLEISTDLPEGWDLKVDVEKDGQKNIISFPVMGKCTALCLPPPCWRMTVHTPCRFGALWATRCGTATCFMPRCLIASMR